MFTKEFSKKYGDLRKRILFTLGALIIYRLGAHIPIPGINPDILRDFMKQNLGGILGMIDMFAGGALSRMTIFALNLMPYITSSIVIQLLTVVSPKLEALKKEGESGRKQLNKYTRYLTVLLASLQGYGTSVLVMSATKGAVYLGSYFPIIAVPTLVGGTLFLMWLGEQITTRGISNGSSLLIFAGILSNLPAAFIQTFELGRTGSISIPTVLIISAMVVAVVMFVVYFESAQRRILIQYPKAANNTTGNPGQHHLPLKVNIAGPIPPIFAGSLLMMPVTLATFSANKGAGGIMSWFSIYLSHGHPVYITLYAAMIMFFTFFYLSIAFNPTETADNLRKNGGFIAGFRPGKQTADYLEYVLTRITVLGAIYLAFLCILPEILIAKFSIPFYLGGTSILIVVSVTMDVATQIKTYMMSQQYQGIIKKIKGRQRG